MRAKISLLASLLGLLLASAAPSCAETDADVARTNAPDTWKKKIVNQLMRKKEYPPGAIGQSGTAKVKFVIDRQGKLISEELVESAGSELLDAAALRMVERAAPFPEPPAEVKDERLTFTLPVVFAKRQTLPWAGGEWPKEWVEEQRKVETKMHGVCRGC